MEASGEILKGNTIIALTANAIDGDMQRCLQSGMDGYLSKPFSVSQLYDQLTPWLSIPRHNDTKIKNVEQIPSNTYVPTEQSTAVDASALNKIASLQPGNSAVLVNKVINLYIKTLNESVALFDEYDTDHETIKKAMHTLKSSSANVGAFQLAKLSNTLEQALKVNHLSSIPQLINEIKTESQRVILYFNETNNE
jgi:two-component system, sensor histidine kinase and response regulator